MDHTERAGKSLLQNNNSSKTKTSKETTNPNPRPTKQKRIPKEWKIAIMVT